MDVGAVWKTVRVGLSSEYGDDVLISWINQLKIQVSDDSSMIIIFAPNKFHLDWIVNNYAEVIKKIIMTEFSDVKDVLFREDDTQKDQSNSHSTENHQETYSFKQQSIDFEKEICEKEDQEQQVNVSSQVISNNLDKNLTFENFVVGKSNEFAYAAAMRVAESDKTEFNPLFIYGGVGLGKTHLLNAIAWHIKKNSPDRKVIYLSAEKFMYEFIRSVRYKTTMDFKEQFRSVDVLMIDDIQFICGKESTQEEFFHTFNALVDKNRQVIISADSSPSDLAGMEDRMKSRLGWGLVADVHPTNYELRLGILQHKSLSMEQPVPKRVLEFIAQKVTSNVRELEGALTSVVAKAVLTNHEITLDLAQDVLSDVIRANDRKITIEEIQKKVADHFSIRISEMYSDKRSKDIARPRQIAMYLSKKLTNLSFPDIGRKFGGRDHTTVMHAVKKITKLMLDDVHFEEDVLSIEKTL